MKIHVFKYKVLQVLSLALLIGFVSTEQYSNYYSFFNYHPLAFLHLLFASCFVLFVIKSKSFAIWKKDVLSGSDVETLKNSVLYLCLGLSNFGLYLNEVRWLEPSYRMFERSYCVFPVCIEGRGLGVYIVLSLSIIMILKAIKSLRKVNY